MSKFKSLEEAQDAFDSLSKDHIALKETCDEQESIINDQKALITEIRGAKTASSAPSFTLNKETYVVKAASFNWEGKTVTASELCKNKELQAKLIEAGVGFIELK